MIDPKIHNQIKEIVNNSDYSDDTKIDKLKQIVIDVKAATVQDNQSMLINL